MDKNDMFLFAAALPGCPCACCHGCNSGWTVAEVFTLLRRELCSEDEAAPAPTPPPLLSGDMTLDGGNCRSCSCSEEGRSSCELSDDDRERDCCGAPLCTAAVAATGLAAAPFAVVAAELAAAAMLGRTRSRTGLGLLPALVWLCPAPAPGARLAASGCAGATGGAAARVRPGGGGCCCVCCRRLIRRGALHRAQEKKRCVRGVGTAIRSSKSHQDRRPEESEQCAQAGTHNTLLKRQLHTARARSRRFEDVRS